MPEFFLEEGECERDVSNVAPWICTCGRYCKCVCVVCNMRFVYMHIYTVWHVNLSVNGGYMCTEVCLYGLYVI